MNTANAPATTIDVRQIAPRERHPMIFAAFDRLGASEALELVNDHDPKPLHYQFQAELPGEFVWDTLESGPEVWRVLITRQGTSPAGGACCGCCGKG